MSALGQKRTCAAQNRMSALPQKQTFNCTKRMSALCQIADIAPLRAAQYEPADSAGASSRVNH